MDPVEIPSERSRPRTRTMAFLFGFLSSAIALLMVVALGEGYCRYQHARWIEKRLAGRTDEDLMTQPAGGGMLYRLKPLVEGMTNSHGYRDVARDQRKQAGTYRIGVIGDSVSMMRLMDLDDLYWRLLECKLDSALSPQDVEIMNFGVTGYSTYQQVIQLESEVLAFEPDAILWQFHDNDARDPEFDGGSGELATYYSQAPSRLWHVVKSKVKSKVLLSRRNAMMKATEGLSLSNDLQLQLFYWDRMSRALDTAASLCAEKDLPVFVFLYPTWPVDDDWARYSQRGFEVHRLLSARFEDLGWHTLDLLVALRELDPAAFRVSEKDRWHPNQAGHRWIAAQLAGWMEPILDESLAK